MTRPALGQSVADPDTGIPILRISESFPPAWTGVEYSTVNPFNCTSELLLLVKVDHFGLWDSWQGMSFLQDLDRITASSNPRWDLTVPSLFYFVAGNALMAMDVVSRDVQTLQIFREYASISVGGGEGTISPSGLSLPIIGTRADGGQEVFVFGLKNAVKGGVLATSGLDAVYLASDFDVVVKWPGKIELYDGGAKYVRPLFDTDGHGACGSGPNGLALFITDSNSRTADPALPNSIVRVDLMDGKRYEMLSLGWSEAIHVCATATAETGKLYVETWVDPTNFQGPLPPFANKILCLPVDGSAPSVVCGHQSSVTDYPEQPRVSFNADGNKAVFGSDFMDISDPNYEDVYMIDLAVTHQRPPNPGHGPHGGHRPFPAL